MKKIQKAKKHVKHKSNDEHYEIGEDQFVVNHIGSSKETTSHISSQIDNSGLAKSISPVESDVSCSRTSEKSCIDLSQEDSIEHSRIDLCQHVPEQVMNAGVRNGNSSKCVFLSQETERGKESIQFIR